MRSMLITGGAGFIGSHLASYAAANTDARIVVLDALTYAGNLSNIQHLVSAGRVEFVRGNICDQDLVQQVLDRHSIDTVMHLAAESHVDRSISGPAAFIETNVRGTATLLECVRSCWQGQVDGCRFLHVSTDEVFGSLGVDDPPFCESTPYSPNSPYAASKAASDHLARAWHHTYDLPVVVTNCSNNYGPMQFPEKLIPLVVLNALEHKPLPIYGDGRQVRDWLHVEDHCEALLLAAQLGEPGETYCIGGANELANIDIVHRICDCVDALDQRMPGSTRGLIQHVRDRLGHDRRYAIDAGKAQQALGWRPRHSFEDGLAEVVAWYMENRAWTDAVRSGAYLDYYKQHYGEP